MESLIELLVRGRHAESKEAAVFLIRRGRVIVNRERVYDENVIIDPSLSITVTGQGKRFVSRGGQKLEHALIEFDCKTSGKICLDVGSSTGGFTDCLLAYGASRVYAVDVGYGLLEWELRNHPKVVVLERTNAKNLTSKLIPEPINLVTIDVSHISLSNILPVVFSLLDFEGEVFALFKPQFEIPREWTSGDDFESGVVKSTALLKSILKTKIGDFANMGFPVSEILESPITGAAGNREFFLRFKQAHKEIDYDSYVKIVDGFIESF